MKAFKDGAFRLSIEQQVPLIPIVLTGTYDTLLKKGKDGPPAIRLAENKDMRGWLIFELGKAAYDARGAVEARNMAKLADLGLARSSENENEDASLTQTGQAVGRRGVNPWASMRQRPGRRWC